MKTALRVGIEKEENGHNTELEVDIKGMDECMAVFRALAQAFRKEPMALMCIALTLKELREETEGDEENKE